jgi:hypothetical protein
VTSLWYCGRWGRGLEHRAYVFDQEMARLGLSYHAALDVRWRRRALLVTVPAAAAAQVAWVIASLERR